ncbi:MAG: hypothetical protein SFV54_19070 [Bryobacteraceae bacterium]|nr:hypothetical protein [Bryobacteraceae bacterium]
MCVAPGLKAEDVRVELAENPLVIEGGRRAQAESAEGAPKAEE